MVPQWIIEKKRDGGALTGEEIREFIARYTSGEIPDYQMAAFAMAVYFRGMSVEETAALTGAMMRSGDLVDTSAIDLPKADKHSTGGIGDKVSLVLAPLAAACGVAVPMISGRGLGITGGTLDKLESIPGYRTDLDEASFLRIVDTCGCSIMGQTERIAPADRKLYALRDVTGTVPSIPLITASIMAKKLAEGIDALVLDVKCGSGAFMKTRDDARELAHSLIRVGRAMGKRVAALLTDMHQPLGRTAGNALEVREAIEALQGGGPEDLRELTVALTARMLVLTDAARDADEAVARARERLDDGTALARFRHMVELHGGDPRVLDEPDRLPSASSVTSVNADRTGWVRRVDAEIIGRACIELGAGRRRTDDRVDPAVGVSNLRKIGEHIAEGEPLAVLHASTPEHAAAAARRVHAAFDVSEEPVERPALILELLGEDAKGAGES